jgi:SAM-dependent methyltransferase
MFLKSIAAKLIRTPFHPQWLLGKKTAPRAIFDLKGVVLDIGAGDRWVRPFLGKDIEYVAVDYPAIGKALYKSSPDVFADGMQLPFSNACADAVLCFEVAEHVPDPYRLVSEIARVLRSGGRTFISMPFIYPIHDAPYDYQRYTLHGLQRLVEHSGLKLVSIKNKSKSIHIAAVMCCLAIAGGVAKTNSLFSILLAPLAVLLITLINVFAFFFGLIWPNWDAMTFGYELEAIKP